VKKNESGEFFASKNFDLKSWPHKLEAYFNLKYHNSWNWVISRGVKPRCILPIRMKIRQFAVLIPKL